MGGILTTVCLMCRLNTITRNKNKNLSLLALGVFSSLILLLIPTSTVFAQASDPWELFQMLCGTGRLASGPQCQNLLTGTNTCTNGLLFAAGVCIPTNTGVTTPNTGVPTTTCPSGYILQNSACVPTNPSSPPVADAGISQTATSGTTVFLDGSRSSATNGATIVSYSWVQSPGSVTVTLTGANTVTPSFLAPPVVNQTPLVFSLTVTDSLGQVSIPSSVTVTVFPS